MRRLLVLASALVLIMGLALVGCDSDDNGGGGTTPAAATGSTMAGKWNVSLVLGGGGTLKSTLTIDQNGVVTQYFPPWWLCGFANAVRVRGTLTQTGGDVQYGCPGQPAQVIWTDRFRLRVVDANRLQGSLVTYYRSNLAIPKFTIVLTRK